MTSILSLLIGIVVPTAHASVIDTAGVDDGAGVAGMWNTICTTLPFCDVGSSAPQFFLDKITNFVFSIIVGVGVVVIIWAGIRLVSSAGDEQRITEARTTVIWAVVGLLAALVARTVILFIGNDLLPRILGS